MIGLVEIIGETLSSIGVGGSIVTLGIVGMVALYGVRFAKLLSSLSTVILVVLGVLVVGTLLGWLEIGAIVEDVSTGIRLGIELVADAIAGSGG